MSLIHGAGSDEEGYAITLDFVKEMMEEFKQQRLV